MAALAQASRSAPSAANLEEVDEDSPSASQPAAVTTAEASPPTSQGAESIAESINNGDASSQEWEKVSQHEEEEKKAEDIVKATDESLKQVAEETLGEARDETPLVATE
jgi:hypothetical protein